LIDRAGGDNVIRSGGKGYRLFGMEEVLLENPEIIVLASEMGLGTARAEQEKWKRWDLIDAVRHNRIHVMNSDLMHRPGPRIVDAIESLAGLLHADRAAADQRVGSTAR
jgi:iron complex transport system substrate-binding protein